NPILPPGEDQLQYKPVPMCEAREVIDKFEMRIEPSLGRFFRIRFQVVHAADAVQQIEAQPGVVAEKGADLDQSADIHRDPRVDRVEFLPRGGRAETLFQNGDNLGWSHELES